MEKFLRYARPVFAPDLGGSAGDLTDPVEAVLEEPVEAEAPEPTPEPAPQGVPLDVFQRRVAALTRQKAELERERDEARASLVAEPVAAATPPQPNMVMEAQALAAQMRFNEKSADVAAAGRELAPDFLSRIVNMNQMLGQLPTPFLEMVMEVGGSNEVAAKLLYDLGGDLAKASSIISLSPAKQVVALSKLLPGTARAPTPSHGTTPAPITPRVGSGGRAASAAVSLADPKMAVEDWMSQRDAEARTRRRR